MNVKSPDFILTTLGLLRLSRHEIEDVSVLHETVLFGTFVIVSSDVNSLVRMIPFLTDVLILSVCVGCYVNNPVE